MSRTWLLLTVPAFLIALFATGAVTRVGALFTDSADVPANTFSTGTVDLTTSPTSALVTLSAMAPGDQVTAPITVTSSGTLDLRYAVTSTTTEDVLASQLALTVKSGVAACTDGGFAGSGRILYGPAPLGSTAALNLVGDPAPGAQAGDRALASAASDTLCFNVSLPLSTSNAFAGLTTTATFSFIGEQTKNNP